MGFLTRQADSNCRCQSWFYQFAVLPRELLGKKGCG
jgi:hypothetical protein